VFLHEPKRGTWTTSDDRSNEEDTEMLGLRESKTTKAREALSDAISYADDLVHDERLRSDLQSALGHGLAAGRRLREDSGVAGLAERIESDRKLRKNVRGMLDDLDRAAGRARRRTSHRLRNTLLVLGGGGFVLALVPRARRWIEAHWSSPDAGKTLPLAD